MRTCVFEVYEKLSNESTKKGMVKKSGWFHSWGFEMYENVEGDGNYSIGICEGEDGKIYTPCPEDIKFTDRNIINKIYTEDG